MYQDKIEEVFVRVRSVLNTAMLKVELSKSRSKLGTQKSTLSRITPTVTRLHKVVGTLSQALVLKQNWYERTNTSCEKLIKGFGTCVLSSLARQDLDRNEWKLENF